MMRLSLSMIRRILLLHIITVGCLAQDRRISEDSDFPIQYWVLRSGSRIAYIRVPAANPLEASPLFFLHGGPGAYQVASFERGREWYKRLSQLGFDVYLYDQVGSGLSNRLSDPTEYTVERHLTDLEEIRNLIKAEKLILVGDSWGATLAANYIARYANRVAKVIFTSPGPIDPGAWIEHYPSPRLDPVFQGWIMERSDMDFAIPCQHLNSLLLTDIQAAYAVASDTLMDRAFDGFITEWIIPTAVHDARTLGDHKFAMHGMGWWVSTMTSWDAVNRKKPVASTLRNAEVPVLILRGNSDYLPFAMAEQYASTFPRATLIRIPTCGHFIWLDKPDLYAEHIQSFLTKDYP